MARPDGRDRGWEIWICHRPQILLWQERSWTFSLGVLERFLWCSAPAVFGLWVSFLAFEVCSLNFCSSFFFFSAFFRLGCVTSSFRPYCMHFCGLFFQLFFVRDWPLYCFSHPSFQLIPHLFNLGYSLYFLKRPFRAPNPSITHIHYSLPIH